jgi:hypothetical protein
MLLVHLRCDWIEHDGWLCLSTRLCGDKTRCLWQDLAIVEMPELWVWILRLELNPYRLNGDALQSGQSEHSVYQYIISKVPGFGWYQ